MDNSSLTVVEMGSLDIDRSLQRIVRVYAFRVDRPKVKKYSDKKLIVD